MTGFQWRPRAPFTAAPFAHTATCGVRAEWLSLSTGKENPGQNGFSSGLARFVPSAGKTPPPPPPPLPVHTKVFLRKK